jgi:hypothetical protein
MNGWLGSDMPTAEQVVGHISDFGERGILTLAAFLDVDAVWLWLGLAGFGVLLLLWLGWRINRWWRGVLLGFSRRRGAAGEEKAVSLLEDAGYEILDEQAQLDVAWVVDGESREYEVRADLLVKRDGERYVAEVKTGEAADLGDRNTRRQLLEYAVVFDCVGVLLVDATKGNIHSVVFPGLARTQDTSR